MHMCPFYFISLSLSIIHIYIYREREIFLCIHIYIYMYIAGRARGPASRRAGPVEAPGAGTGEQQAWPIQNQLITKNIQL